MKTHTSLLLLYILFHSYIAEKGGMTFNSFYISDMHLALACFGLDFGITLAETLVIHSAARL